MEAWLRLFGFPLRVSPFFFIVVALLGSRTRDVVLLAGWVVLATAGVLLHELGHAVMVRRYGRQPVISLHSLGGLTSWSGDLTPGRRLLVSLAGPAVGIAIGIPALLASRALGFPEGSRADTLLDYLWWVNLGWAVFNLIPMLPLDGGKVMASILELVFKGRGWTAARVLSIALAVLIGLLSLLAKSFYLLLLCALFVWSNVQGLRGERRPAVP